MNRDAAGLAMKRVADAVGHATGLLTENPLLLPRRAYEMGRIATILLARWRYGVTYIRIAESMGYESHCGVVRIYALYKDSQPTDLSQVLQAATRILDGEI